MDESGTIELNELTCFLGEEAKAAFLQLDYDGDKRVTLVEFVAFWEDVYQKNGQMGVDVGLGTTEMLVAKARPHVERMLSESG